LLKLGNLSILETEPDKCVAYNRDWARKEQNAQTFARLSDFGSVPYAYLWKDKAWFVSIESDDFSLLIKIIFYE